MPISKANSTPQCAVSGCLGLSAVEAHYLEDGEVGASFYWEERYCLEHLGYKDQICARKRAKASSFMQNLVVDGGLPNSVFSYPSDHAEAIITVVINSQLLLPWVFKRCRNHANNPTHDRQQAAASMLQGVQSVAADGSALFPASASIDALGTQLILLPNATINLVPLVNTYFSLFVDWNALAHHNAGLGLQAVHDVAQPRPIVDVLSFLEARCFRSKDRLPNGHWMLEFRNGLNKVFAVAYEMGIAHRIEAATERAHPLQAVQLYGLHKQRRCRHGAYTKQHWLNKIAEVHGSAETVLETLQNHGGCAAVIRNVRDTLYEEDAKRLFVDCNRVGLSWDGTSNHGLSVNICIAIHVSRMIAAHTRPMVPL